MTAIANVLYFEIEYFVYIFIGEIYSLCATMRFGLLINSFWFLLIGILPACGPEKKAKQQGVISTGSKAEDMAINTLTEGDTAAIHQLMQQGWQAKTTGNHNDSAAIACYTNALKLSGQIGYWEAAATAANNLANCYRERQDFPRANYYQSQFKATSKKIPSRYYNKHNSTHRYMSSNGDLTRANDYYNAGRFDSATQLYLKAIRMLEPADSVNKNALGSAYAALGAMYDHVADSTRALYYFDRILSVARQFGDTDLLLMGLYNRAATFSNGKNLEQSYAMAKEVLSIARQAKNIPYEGDAAYLMANFLISQDKPLQALDYSKQSLQTYTLLGDEDRLTRAHFILGYNYNQLQQYKAAERHLLEGIQLARNAKSYIDLYNAYGQLALTYEHIGNHAQALQYYKLYLTDKDSLRGSENARRISEIETRYQVAQKDRLLARQQLKIANQDKALYMWIGGALFLIMLLFGLLRRNRHKAAIAALKSKLAGEEQERARMAKELHDGIVSQLSLIKTNFSALPVYTRGDSEAGALQEAVQQLDQSIAELRSTAHNLLPDGLLRDGLLQALSNYCDKLSRSGTLEVSFQALGNLPPLSDEFQLNCYRIVQELLQNIHKHSGAGKALVQFNVNGDLLDITVDDNGKGQQAVLQTGQGMGLRNLNERVQLLEGSMKTEHDQGTSVYLSFNMKKYKTLV